MISGEKSSRVERRKEETRQKIIGAAMKLFESQGFEGTTMEQIAEEADVAKRTLYNHFSVKEAIVNEFVQRDFQKKAPIIAELIEAQPDTRSRLCVYLNGLLDWIMTYKDLAEVYMVYRMQNIMQDLKNKENRSGSQIFVKKILEEGRVQGEVRIDLPLEILLRQFDFIRISLVQEMLVNTETFEKDKQIEKYVDLFLKGAGYVN